MRRDIPSSSEPFWDGLEDGEVLLPECGACGHTFFPPGPVCPSCAGTTIEWSPSSGNGILYSFTRQHTTAPGFDEPLVVGLVELDEGPRLLTPIVGPYDSLAIGDPVTVRPTEYDQAYDRGRWSDRPFYVAVAEDA